MNEPTTTPRRQFFKRIVAAALGTVAAGGMVPHLLQSAEKQAEKAVKVSIHPMAVARKRNEEKA